MLPVILLFFGVLSLNPIQKMIYDCEDIGTDLKACYEAETCTFYEISTRAAWDLGTTLEVAIKAADEESFSWYDGEVTSIFGNQITVARANCESGGDVACTVSANRFSFQFRESNPQEFVGMRIEVWREYFDRWIPTNLTAIEKDDWSDLWAYGGDFGNIVGLQPFDVRAAQDQDCHLNRTNIEKVARTLQQESGQVESAIACTKVFEEVLCSDDYNLNCEWNATSSVCLLNEVTDNLISCYQYRSRSDCEDGHLHPHLSCKWLAGSEDNDYEDAFCINDATRLSILFLVLVVLFMF